MAGFGDLIGSFLQAGMAPSGGARMGQTLEQLQRAGLGGLGGGGLMGGVLDAVKGGMGSAAGNPAQAGGLGAIVGGLLGGGRGAVGGGALALLASVAMKALQSNATGAAGSQFAAPPVAGRSGPWSGGDMPLAMRPQREPAEDEALERSAQLVLKGMVNAAKADGRIGPIEMQRIVGKLQESGADQQVQQWLMQQMQEPLDVRAFAAEIPDSETAAQVYAASLLAIEVDTDAERRYLAEFADALGLHPMVVAHIHQTMGVAS